MFDESENNLYIETENGEAELLPIEKLYQILKPDIPNDPLSINTVFVNVINGDKIASVFKKLGVS